MDLVFNPGSEKGWISIFLQNKHGDIVGETLVDKKFSYLTKYKWRLSSFGYAIATINKKQIRLHRLIMNAPINKVVDHINHNKLDNRTSNLRICSNQENCTNREKQHGITFNKEKQKWQAKIHPNYTDVFLGYFDNYDDALIARKAAEKEYYGEFRGGIND
jgi:hypothetical protein